MAELVAIPVFFNFILWLFICFFSSLETPSFICLAYPMLIVGVMWLFCACCAGCSCCFCCTSSACSGYSCLWGGGSSLCSWCTGSYTSCYCCWVFWQVLLLFAFWQLLCWLLLLLLLLLCYQWAEIEKRKWLKNGIACTIQYLRRRICVEKTCRGIFISLVDGLWLSLGKKVCRRVGEYGHARKRFFNPTSNHSECSLVLGFFTIEIVKTWFLASRKYGRRTDT